MTSISYRSAKTNIGSSLLSMSVGDGCYRTRSYVSQSISHGRRIAATAHYCLVELGRYRYSVSVSVTDPVLLPRPTAVCHLCFLLVSSSDATDGLQCDIEITSKR